MKTQWEKNRQTQTKIVTLSHRIGERQWRSSSQPTLVFPTCFFPNPITVSFGYFSKYKLSGALVFTFSFSTGVFTSLPPVSYDLEEEIRSQIVKKEMSLFEAAKKPYETLL